MHDKPAVSLRLHESRTWDHQQVELPEPADGEVVVDIRAVAVSNIVRRIAVGKH
jgi:NADPH:quinone reductase-like Zn-dependent oxidoreductase